MPRELKPLKLAGTTIRGKRTNMFIQFYYCRDNSHESKVMGRLANGDEIYGETEVDVAKKAKEHVLALEDFVSEKIIRVEFDYDGENVFNRSRHALSLKVDFGTYFKLTNQQTKEVRYEFIGKDDKPSGTRTHTTQMVDYKNEKDYPYSIELETALHELTKRLKFLCGSLKDIVENADELKSIGAKILKMLPETAIESEDD